MIIRKARSEDSEAITEVYIKSNRHAFKGMIHQAFLDNGLVFDDINKGFQEWINDPNSGIFLAYDNERLAGFIVIDKSGIKDFPDQAEICKFFLDPDYIRMGIGTKLYRKALEFAINKGFEQMVVCVLPGNKGARAFYEKMGAKLYEGSVDEYTLDDVQYFDVKYIWNELKL